MRPTTPTLHTPTHRATEHVTVPAGTEDPCRAEALGQDFEADMNPGEAMNIEVELNMQLLRERTEILRRVRALAGVLLGALDDAVGFQPCDECSQSGVTVLTFESEKAIDDAAADLRAALGMVVYKPSEPTVDGLRSELETIRAEVEQAKSDRRPTCPVCGGEDARTAKDGIGQCIAAFHSAESP